MPIADSVQMGRDVVIPQPALVNLYGCVLGDEAKVGAFVEIQKNCRVGARCKVSSHSFLCEGVELEEEVFVGHGVMFTNDRYPRATTSQGLLQTESDWEVVKTHVGRRASIGSNATILPGLRIGEGAMVGAGSVVTRDVPPYTLVAGNPARVMGPVPDAP